MNKRFLVLMLCLLVLYAWAVVAQIDEEELTTAEKEALQPVTKFIVRVIKMIQYIGSAILALMVTIVGIEFFKADDPTEKTRLGGRLKGFAIGLVLLLFSIPIVNVIFGLT